MFKRCHYRDRVVPVLVLKAYGEWRCIAPQNLTSVLVGVNGQLHALIKPSLGVFFSIVSLPIAN